MPAGRKEIGDSGGAAAPALKKVTPGFAKNSTPQQAPKPEENIKNALSNLRSAKAEPKIRSVASPAKDDPKNKTVPVVKKETNSKIIAPEKPANNFAVNLRPVNKLASKQPPPKEESESEEELEEEESEEEYTDESTEEESTVSERSSKSNDVSNDSNSQSVRTSFRPNWVKEGPPPLPVPANPWPLNKRGSRDGGKPKDIPPEDKPPAFQMPQLRKTSQAKITPLENGEKEPVFIKPQLKPVPPKEARLQSKEVKIPVKLNKLSERLEREHSIKRAELEKQLSMKEDPEDIEKDFDFFADRDEDAIPSVRNALVKQDSLRKIPKAPPLPPPAPAMPKLFEGKSLNDTQLRKLEQLRARPKVRPDWTAMLKDIEGGRKLNHVQCNDRSEPLLPQAKAKGMFLYDSEKPNVHNVLLKEIQQGINLKKVKTNDRSKPILEGLRKFRRQMTIEEQIIKSQSMASIPPEEVATIADEVDELDDIDKVRDDLQSTKQLLAIELRNKETQIRENKKLLARIQNLEAELEKERAVNKEGKPNHADDKIIKSLKDETEEARKQAEELEKKFTTTAEELDTTKSQLEELRKQKQEIEKKLQEAMSGKRMSMSERKESMKEESEEENFYEDTEPESDGEETEEKKEKRAQRELKMLRNKLRSFKTKVDNAKKERAVLKDLLKKNQTAMKEEKKRYKVLQKEVNKMAAMMKDSDDEENEEAEDEEKPESESESESESETETESSGDESETEKSESEAEDAPNDSKKENLSKRSKRYENILNAMKKGNYVLKTNVERLQDDLNKQKEATATLQEDLDSVLSELG